MKKRLLAIIVSLSIVLSFCTHLMATEAVSVNALSYTLQQSTVYSWNEAAMKKYNCYAYVLGLTDKKYQPGSFSGKTYAGYEVGRDPNAAYDPIFYLDVTADMIVHDLTDGFGYGCVKLQVDCPASLGNWKSVIALRMETKYNTIDDNDFHVAKLTADGWLHKPGETAILKFNYAPRNSDPWIGEVFAGIALRTTTDYTTPLRFILYKNRHSSPSATEWTGQHYHSGTSHFYLYKLGCADCLDLFEGTIWVESPCTGPTCNLPWSVNPDPVTE